MKKEDIKDCLQEVLAKSIDLSDFIRRIRKYKKELQSTTDYLDKAASISERAYSILNSMIAKPTCKMCSNKTKFIRFIEGYRIYCSTKCAMNDPDNITKINIAFLNKYGTNWGLASTEVKEKRKATLFKNYGVTVPAKSKIIIDKHRITVMERYGVDNISKNSVIKQKKEETSFRKYGVSSPSKSIIVQDKIIETSLTKYGTSRPSESTIIREKIQKTHLTNFYNSLDSTERLENKVVPLFSKEEYKGVYHLYKWECIICNMIFEDAIDDGSIPKCPNCFKKYLYKSTYEIVLFDWLNSLNIGAIYFKNKRLIHPYELDIYIPAYSLAIEFNGNYWHCENVSPKCDEYYHINKTNLCKEKGIQLIHIFEDEWVNKQNIVKAIIRRKLKLSQIVSLASCVIKKINNKKANIFIDSNYLFSIPKIDYNYGIFYNNNIVGLIGVIEKQNRCYEFLFCPSNDIKIIDISDIVTYLKNKFKMKSLLCLTDVRYFKGTTYKNWLSVTVSNPTYFYLPINDFRKRYSKYEFNKDRLRNLFPEHYSEDLTEWEIMQKAGYDRIWDCGNLVFEYIG